MGAMEAGKITPWGFHQEWPFVGLARPRSGQGLAELCESDREHRGPIVDCVAEDGGVDISRALGEEPQVEAQDRSRSPLDDIEMGQPEEKR